jgi:hypothetical protein
MKKLLVKIKVIDQGIPCPDDIKALRQQARESIIRN